jgi:hypothetical protein
VNWLLATNIASGCHVYLLIFSPARTHQDSDRRSLLRSVSFGKP